MTPRAALVLLAASLVTSPLFADDAKPEPSAEARAEAIDLGRQGRDLYDQGRWLEAHDRFDRAEALVHSPVFLLYLARTSRNAGKLLDARARYRQLAAAELAPSAPPPWRDAQDDGIRELAEVDRRIPSLSIRALPASAAVTLDGIPVDPARTAPIEVDPGEHQLVAIVQGQPPLAKTIVAQESDKEVVVVIEVPAPVPPPPPLPVPQLSPPPALFLPPEPPPAPRKKSALFISGVTLSAIGSALVITGIGTGAAAIAANRRLAPACPNGACPLSEADLVHRYYALGNTSTATLVIGGAVLASGVVLALIPRTGATIGLSLTGATIASSF